MTFFDRSAGIRIRYQAIDMPSRGAASTAMSGDTPRERCFSGRRLSRLHHRPWRTAVRRRMAGNALQTV
jgi:hypothetical protein